MRPELSKAELERLFVDAADEALNSRDAGQLDAELDADPVLKARFSKYQGALKRLRTAPREKAPEGLASVILRRVRRRRVWGNRDLHTFHANYRVPVEVLVPILVGVLVAAFLIFAAP